MSSDSRVHVLCNHCGIKISIPVGHSRAKIRCSGCGYYAEVPAKLRSAEPVDPRDTGDPVDELPVIQPSGKPAKAAVDSYFDEEPRKHRANKADQKTNAESAPKPPKATARPNPNPKDIRPDFLLADDAPRGPNELEGTQDEDDDQPYAVPGSGLKRCHECGTQLPLDSKICIHCGVDFQSKKKQKKAYQPISQEWEPRFNLQTRLKIFIGLQILNIAVVFLFFRVRSIDGALLFLMMQGAIQAFLVGSFERLGVVRNSKGQANLTRTWRIAFIPLTPREVDWKEQHGVGVIAIHSMGLLEWITLFYLLLLLILPGVLFYIFVLHPLRYNIVLCDEYGVASDRLFQGTSEDQAKEVSQVISTATGLTNRSII
jgi:ribosomal protein L37E